MTKLIKNSMIVGAILLSGPSLLNASSEAKSPFKFLEKKGEVLADTPFSKTLASGIEKFCIESVDFQGCYQQALEDPSVISGDVRPETDTFKTLLLEFYIQKDAKKKLKETLIKGRKKAPLSDVTINRMAIYSVTNYFDKTVEEHGGWEACHQALENGMTLKEPVLIDDKEAQPNSGEGSDQGNAVAPASANKDGDSNSDSGENVEIAPTILDFNAHQEFSAAGKVSIDGIVDEADSQKEESDEESGSETSSDGDESSSDLPTLLQPAAPQVSSGATPAAADSKELAAHKAPTATNLSTTNASVSILTIPQPGSIATAAQDPASAARDNLITSTDGFGVGLVTPPVASTVTTTTAAPKVEAAIGSASVAPKRSVTPPATSTVTTATAAPKVDAATDSAPVAPKRTVTPPAASTATTTIAAPKVEAATGSAPVAPKRTVTPPAASTVTTTIAAPKVEAATGSAPVAPIRTVTPPAASTATTTIAAPKVEAATGSAPVAPKRSVTPPATSTVTTATAAPKVEAATGSAPAAALKKKKKSKKTITQEAPKTEAATGSTPAAPKASAATSATAVTSNVTTTKEAPKTEAATGNTPAAPKASAGTTTTTVTANVTATKEAPKASLATGSTPAAPLTSAGTTTTTVTANVTATKEAPKASLATGSTPAAPLTSAGTTTTTVAANVTATKEAPKASLATGNTPAAPLTSAGTATTTVTANVTTATGDPKAVDSNIKRKKAKKTAAVNTTTTQPGSAGQTTQVDLSLGNAASGQTGANNNPNGVTPTSPLTKGTPATSAGQTTVNTANKDTGISKTIILGTIAGLGLATYLYNRYSGKNSEKHAVIAA